MQFHIYEKTDDGATGHEWQRAQQCTFCSTWGTEQKHGLYGFYRAKGVGNQFLGCTLLPDRLNSRIQKTSAALQNAVCSRRAVPRPRVNRFSMEGGSRHQEYCYKCCRLPPSSMGWTRKFFGGSLVGDVRRVMRCAAGG